MENGLVVGVDLGGTQVRAVLGDTHGKLLERHEVNTNASEGLAAVLDRIVGAVQIVREGRSGIAAVGIGAPGPINFETGVVSTPPNLPGWVNVPLAQIVKERTGLPAFLGNDANLAALGEFTYGAGKYVQHLIYITVSTGVGGGVIVDGELLEGRRGAAGEIGHMVVEPEGPKCSCGGLGHLEALVSGTSLARQANEAIAGGRATRMTEIAKTSPTGLTARVVTDAAQEGDELAVELVERAGRRLGYAVINLVHVFNPQMVTIGGGVTSAGELLLAPMRAVVLDGVMPVFKEDLQMVPASLGRDAGLWGAVALAIRAGANVDTATSRTATG